MAIKKISEFDLITELAFLDLVITSWYDGVDYVSKKARIGDLLNAGTKTFKAFISQDDVADPVTTEIYNNHIDTPVAARVSTGTYKMEGFDNLLGTSTAIRINTNMLSQGHHIKTVVDTDDKILIYTYNGATLTDSVMNLDGLVIEVITYL
ncbi:hypothetical protein UFOVP425_47 [uncultured Caudovirales phage]|uniref:Uncharacterized protein n=1 Tax=uncultured Caudovirales phage TaxID=2100421 RepID=A0A6J5MAB0_9CAUD|nr:hypothetical protein UFOVP425_47 [uncultured Caudovirales phage]